MKLWIVVYGGRPGESDDYSLGYLETAWLIRADVADAAIDVALEVCGEDHMKRPEHRDIWRAVDVDTLQGRVVASFTGVD